MNLAEPVRTSIEQWATALRDESALAKLASAGGLTPKAVAYYLTSLRYLLASSERHLELAAERAQALGDQAVADYFARKVREEQGHDAWADDDLARLPDGASRGLEPSPWILKLVALQRALIERHPVCFVVYALWAEYFTVLVADEWLAGLAASGFGREHMTAISNHVEADLKHAAHGFAELDQLWKGQPEREVMLGIVREASAVFDAFCDDVCAQARRAA